MQVQESPKLLSLQVITWSSIDWVVVNDSVALAKSPLKVAIDENIELLRDNVLIVWAKSPLLSLL